MDATAKQKRRRFCVFHGQSCVLDRTDLGALVCFMLLYSVALWPCIGALYWYRFCFSVCALLLRSSARRANRIARERDFGLSVADWDAAGRQEQQSGCACCRCISSFLDGEEGLQRITRAPRAAVPTDDNTGVLRE